MPRYAIIWKTYTEKWRKIDPASLSISEMKRTWQVLEEFKFWFLSQATSKNDFATEHLILWQKDDGVSVLKYKELYDLIESFSKSDYICWRNPSSRQSIPLIPHYHIAKFKDMDIEITKLL